MPTTDAGWLPLAAKIVRQFEGLERPLPNGNYTAYLCPAGVWTIGVGSTGKDIKRGTVWTKAQCEARFLHDLNAVYGPAVDKLLLDPTTPGKKAALVSFCYNLGADALGRSTLIRCHNDGNTRAAGDQFLRWTRAGGKVLRGLVKRREAERKLYLGIP